MRQILNIFTAFCAEPDHKDAQIDVARWQSFVVLQRSPHDGISLDHPPLDLWQRG
jgi:hypothetical protein